ncbi:Glyoxylase, beta-lactamase superfamily II [Paenibacillus sp. UNC496MF]|uniref:MBL fold metallo-hydrolase n=1 Tax=Paenibacillus sp. UNC496MF TaxID=1502753 RepID=UPI0008E36BC9|nr:MBL fold metallo-hydrolase [Paenibacillus sp. UNC496MF]SFI54616.1 Glyoxylase, beta-lactamase superfamily II [Paenibacillus sp. UNC496MF]
MFIANGIAMLELRAVVMGRTTAIHPTLLWRDDRVLLVDTGYPGQLPLLREAMTEAGRPLESLTDVLLTHQDIDHIGGLPGLRDGLPARPVTWASAFERPYVQGEKLLVKITPDAVDAAVAALPPEVPDDKRAAFRQALLHPPSGPVDRLIGYGHAEAPLEDVEALDTPGHTPGHVSLYHRPSGTLIAGDALVLEDGRLKLPDARLNSDHEQARRSLRQLAGLAIAGVVCYHGGYFKGDVQAQLRELLA